LICDKGEREVDSNLNLLRFRLEVQRKELIAALAQLGTSVNYAKGKGAGNLLNDRGEVAMVSFELERFLALKRQMMSQLYGVEDALQRFDEGGYGLCEDCGQPLDPARLEALPQAKLCLSCKGKNEKGRYLLSKW